MKAPATIVLLLVVIAAGFWGVALRGATRAPGPGLLSPVQPLPYPGADRLVARRVVAEHGFHASPSPDGTRLAYQATSGDLALLDLRTGEHRLLTGDSTVWGRRWGWLPLALRFRFSPDGQRVAYLWIYYDTANVRAIRVLDLATGQVQEIFRDTGTSGFLGPGSWSPDGETVAVVSADFTGAGRIVLVRVQDGVQTTIASFDSHCPENATFSPDGRWLAYHRPRHRGSDDHDIFLRSVDGAVEVKLTRGPGNYQVAGWLPGGGPLFYLTGQHSRFDLMAVELEDGLPVSDARLVRPDLWHVAPQGFSGNAFFFAQRPERSQTYTARFHPEEGRLITPLTPLFPAAALYRSAEVAWAPDGNRMAYMEGTDLVVRSLGTGAERRIRTALSAGYLEWSPAPDRLAIQSFDRVTRIRGIYVVDLADGSIELVLPSRGDTLVFQPRWATDGEALFVAREQPVGRDAGAIIRLDLRSGEKRVVFRAETEHASTLTGFALHPDGRHLAVGLLRPAPLGGKDHRVVLVPVEGGEPRELVRVDAPEGISYGPYGLEWTPDGRHLIIAGNTNPEQRRTFWIVNHDGTGLRELVSITSAGAHAGTPARPRLHAGGREISVIAGRTRWEAWALDGLRPLAPPSDSTEGPDGGGSDP
jgi:Tol biopolymer transport system component